MKWKKNKKEVSTTIQWNLRDNLLYKAKKFRQTNHNPRYKIGLEERELIIRSRIKLVSLPNKYDFRKEGEDCLVPWGNSVILQYCNLAFILCHLQRKKGQLSYLISYSEVSISLVIFPTRVWHRTPTKLFYFPSLDLYFQQSF